MGFWSWFTTSEKAVDTGLDLVSDISSGIDMLVHTDEEKAIYNLKVADALASHVTDTMGENTERSKARRWIAKTIKNKYCFP